LGSCRPAKYLSSSLWNTDLGGETRANSVAEDRSFQSSGDPKTVAAELPGSARVASTHSVSRGPSTGWARYALASSGSWMAYFREVGLKPRPSSYGNMNHIQ